MGFFNRLWDGITSTANKAGNWINNNIINPVGEAINNIVDKTREDTKNNGIISGIGTGIKETVNEIKEGIKPITETVKEGIKPITETVKEGIKPITETVKEGIKPITEPIKNTFIPNTETNQNTSTETNEDFNANGNSNPIEEAKKEKEDYLKRIWEREDKIRKETQEREDSAYSRAIADMRKSGINPNLVGINPASSGGGIINASMPEQTLNAEISAYSQQLIAELQRELELDENKKNRLSDILGKGLSGLANIIAFK